MFSVPRFLLDRIFQINSFNLGKCLHMFQCLINLLASFNSFEILKNPFLSFSFHLFIKSPSNIWINFSYSFIYLILLVYKRIKSFLSGFLIVLSLNECVICIRKYTIIFSRQLLLFFIQLAQNKIFVICRIIHVQSRRSYHIFQATSLK